MADIDEMERSIAKIERHLGMGGIHNMCDRCGKLTGILFIVTGTFSRLNRYCFKCVLVIYLIDLKYWILSKLLLSAEKFGEINDIHNKLCRLGRFHPVEIPEIYRR